MTGNYSPDMLPNAQDATVLFLHPGAMGARMAGECRAGRRLWVATGRSAATVERASGEGLEATTSLAEATSLADLVVSICPPASAATVAASVATLGYQGLYLDANAVSPTTMTEVSQQLAVAGGNDGCGDDGNSANSRLVDGGVIGPPPGTVGTTRLYLASAETQIADWVAGLWAGSALGTKVIEPQDQQHPYSASALKMAYAAWTKGSAALLASVAAAASSLGVDNELRQEWELSQPGLNERAERTAAGVGPKAWRFAAEMTEIAATFDGAGVPNGFWHAAAEAYERLAPLKGESAPDLTKVIDLLVRINEPRV